MSIFARFIRFLLLGASLLPIASKAQQISDNTMVLNWENTCLAQAREFGREACDADSGGPHGALCRNAPKYYQRCAHPPVTGGVITPKYLIAGVVYVPPGCTSTATMKCGVLSSVSYAQDSTLGTKFAIQASFKQSESAKASISLGLTGVTFDSSGSADFSTTHIDDSSFSITKTNGRTLSVLANGDGIDHNQDKIYLLLNPVIAVEELGNQIEWSLGHTQANWVPYELPVAYLRPGATIPSPVQSVLNQAHIGATELAEILKADPLASVTHPITKNDLDPNRYAPLYTFDYEPAQIASDCNGTVCSCTAVQNTLKNTVSTDQSVQNQNSSSISASVGVTLEQKTQANVYGVQTTTSDFKEGLSISDTMTYTNSTTNSNSQSNSNSAAVTISCASPAWTGQTILDVYWDNVYGSFAFVLRDPFPGDEQIASEQAPLTPLRMGADQFPPVPTARLYYGDERLAPRISKDGSLHFYGQKLQGVSGAVLRREGQPTKVIPTVP